MTAVSDETGREALESPQHIVEGIILRRLHAKRIEGYTLEMSKEIAAALSAAPVAQEPVARLCGYCKTWNSKPCGEQCYLQPNDPVWTSPPASPVAQEPVARLVPIKNLVAMLALLPPAPVDVNGKQFAYHDPKAAERLLELRSVFDALIAASPLYTSPPATPAGTPANRGDRVIYWLKRYQADEHLDDDACEELDALINVLSKGVKVQPPAGLGADEIAPGDTGLVRGASSAPDHTTTEERG